MKTKNLWMIFKVNINTYFFLQLNKLDLWQKKIDRCASTKCRDGETCILNKDGDAECACITQCEDPKDERLMVKSVYLRLFIDFYWIRYVQKLIIHIHLIVNSIKCNVGVVKMMNDVHDKKLFWIQLIILDDVKVIKTKSRFLFLYLFFFIRSWNLHRIWIRSFS